MKYLKVVVAVPCCGIYLCNKLGELGRYLYGKFTEGFKSLIKVIGMGLDQLKQLVVYVGTTFV
ncbi:hypothetical protein, partial [Borrelia persica]|uniref:hypothetical protein n=1 Tax=Borrelia persica TaxID=44448 RepID=UPI001F17528C